MEKSGTSRQRPGSVARITAMVLITSGFANPCGARPAENADDVLGLPDRAVLEEERRETRDVRRDDAVVETQQRIVGVDRLDLGDVERRPRQPPALEGRGERAAVDDRAARGVDQDRGRFHQRQRASVDEVTRLGGRRAVDGHVVGLRQQLLERHQAHAVEIGARLRDIGVAGEDARGAETADAHREGTADVAETDDADGVAGDASHAPVVLEGDAAILAPGALPRGADRVVEATRQRQ